MIPIHIRPKRNASVTHFAKPVKFPVEGQVLENAENADQEAENHSEPNEAAPVLKRAKSLHGEKEEDQVGDKKQELHPRAIGRRGAMKKPLGANHHGKRRQRREQRRKQKVVSYQEVDRDTTIT